MTGIPGLATGLDPTSHIQIQYIVIETASFLPLGLSRAHFKSNHSPATSICGLRTDTMASSTLNIREVRANLRGISMTKRSLTIIHFTSYAYPSSKIHENQTPLWRVDQRFSDAAIFPDAPIPVPWKFSVPWVSHFPVFCCPRWYYLNSRCKQTFDQVPAPPTDLLTATSLRVCTGTATPSSAQKRRPWHYTAVHSAVARPRSKC